MALLKAELLHARIRRDGPNLRERMLSSVDRLGRLGCVMPRTANALLNVSSFRHIASRILGFTTERPLPRFALQRFDHWFEKHEPSIRPWRNRVILWDDTFVRYYDSQIGMAAVKLLETCGFDVVLPAGRQCCGRPAFSQGNLGEASRLGRHNLALLKQSGDAPIIFLEPSCYSMFAEDYRELKLPDAEAVAARCFLIGEFFENFLTDEPLALRFNNKPERLLVHMHCHAKTLVRPDAIRHLLERLPRRTVTMLDTGCCGMAGAFGMLESKYALSVKVAEPLIQAIKNQPYGSTVVASGSSCRQQIQHLAQVRLRHLVEVLAEALA
jgi:Fe-S oxidoreductase